MCMRTNVRRACLAGREHVCVFDYVCACGGGGRGRGRGRGGAGQWGGGRGQGVSSGYGTMEHNNISELIYISSSSHGSH